MTRDEMVAKAVAYFADVDRFDTDAIMSHFASDAVMEVPSHATSRSGLAEIRDGYERRAKAVKSSRHGDFVFMVDGPARRLAVRLSVRRTMMDGTPEATDNVTIIEFAASERGGKIVRLSAWLPGVNTLK